MRDNGKINNEQKKLLHVAARELGMDEDMYREILRQEAGVQSSKDLTKQGFDKVMRRFKKLGFKKTGKPYSRPNPPVSNAPDALVTEGLMYKIQMLYREIGFRDKKRQMGFNQRVCKKPWPQTRAEANQIIEALKKMAARGYKGGEKTDEKS